MKTLRKPHSLAQTDSTQVPETIVCRPDRTSIAAMMVLSVLAGASLVGLLLSPPEGATRPRHVSLPALMAMVGFMLVLVSVTFAVGVRQWQQFICADANGLHGRNLRGNRWTIAWGDVEDYRTGCTQSFSGIATQPRLIRSGFVIGRDGTRLTFQRDWTNAAVLTQRIRACATAARAHDWAPVGCRPQDGWPRTFRYRLRWSWFVPTLTAVTTLACTVAATVTVFRNTVDTVPANGWGFCLTFTVLTAAILGFISIGTTHFAVPDRLTRARLSQTITLSRDGLQFTDGASHLTASWEDVTDARIIYLPNRSTVRFVVQTAAGDFDFTGRLLEGQVLANAIIYNAPRIERWRILEDCNALPVRQVTPSGVFVHHYRTYYNRLGLRVWWGWVFFPLLLIPIGADPTSSLFAAFLLWWAGTVLLPLCWFVWRYFTARIDRDADGLTFHTLLGARHLLWSQITDFRLLYKEAVLCEHGMIGIIDSRVGRFVFFTNLSEKERLFRAIEAHLPA